LWSSTVDILFLFIGNTSLKYGYNLPANSNYKLHANVTWTNINSGSAANVTTPNGSFQTTLLSKDNDFTIVHDPLIFEVAGTYNGTVTFSNMVSTFVVVVQVK